MKANKRQLIFILLSILWMGIIFWFSARTGDESSAQSGGIVLGICRLIFRDFIQWDPAKQDAIINILTILVRKGCHATEYCILALLLLGSQSWKYSLKRNLFTSWILTVCYAASDEIHQYFVPERACMLRDVIIDSAGAAVGLLLVYFILRFRNQKNQLH